MKDFTNLSLNLAQTLGATYADIRIVNTKSSAIIIKNGKPEAITYSTNQGFGVRVLANGSWGFASSFNITNDEIERITNLALKIAQASALTKKEDVKLASIRPVCASYKTPIEIDPFEVSIAEKLETLLKAEKILRTNKDVKISQASMSSGMKKQIFASSEGSYITQTIYYTGAGIKATALKDGDVQIRSYPNSHGGQYETAGYEVIKLMDLEKHAERLAFEAVALLSAKPCPNITTNVILGNSQLALQVHESIGHPTELDRVFKMEESLAGTTFLTPDKLGKFQVASPIVNITADATVKRGLGSFGYDDEGVPAQKTYLVRDGVFSGYLSSRETADLLGQESNGTMRADGWNRIPLIRMTNINLEPGEWKLEDLIADTEDGILLDTNKSWSIDDKRLNFQFATEIGWQIKNGEIGQIIKNPNYTGITNQFWNSCDAIGNQEHWKVWGLPNCGKGEPIQTAYVGHGTSPARFRNVRVGVGKK